MTTPPMRPTRATAVGARRAAQRISAEQSGRRAEWIATLMLVVRGYRILARRWRCHAGEIDIIAVRGRRLAFVEVKFRGDRDAMSDAVTTRQCRRLYEAADTFVARYARYAESDRAFDAIFLVAGALPAYAPDHLRPLGAPSNQRPSSRVIARLRLAMLRFLG